MITPEYIESIKAFDKAVDAIENAKYNLKGGFLLATANRAITGVTIAWWHCYTLKKCIRKPTRV